MAVTADPFRSRPHTVNKENWAGAHDGASLLSSKSGPWYKKNKGYATRMIKQVEWDSKAREEPLKSLGKEEGKQKQELSHAVSTARETEGMKAPRRT